MLSDVFLSQTITLILCFSFIYVLNTFVIWYLILSIICLISMILFLDNFDIFVGFLLLIDLGVILIFLVFVFHFVNFLDNTNLIKRYPTLYVSILLLSILLSIMFIFSNNSTYGYSFSFFITWYDYFLLNLHYFKTDLNLLKEVYFYNNSFEFIVINLFIIYGLVLAIITFFLIKKMNLKKILYFFKSYSKLNLKTSYLFIRNQNIIAQQDEGSVLKIIRRNK